MRVEMQRAECRTLSEAELNCVSGGTSGLIYAVAHEIQKAVHEHSTSIDTRDGKTFVLW